jgi:hypothetical protein
LATLEKNQTALVKPIPEFFKVKVICRMKNADDILLRSSIKIQRTLPLNLLSSDFADFQGQSSYNTSQFHLKFIGNARVSSDSVFYRKGILMDEAVAPNNHKFYYQTRYLLKKFLTCKKIKLSDNRKYLLATNLESHGHFHWFVETLPKLFCAKEFAGEFTLLLPDKPYIRKIGLESLKLLDLNFAEVVLMKETEFYQIRNLYHISGTTEFALNDELLKEIRSVLTDGRRPGKRRLYISREKARFRKILNEKELTGILKGYGFEVLHAEDLTLSEQIDIFSSCETLLGIHGAGLTNCIFMKEAGNIVELRRKELQGNNTGYWHLSDALRHKYYYYNGIPDSDKSIIGNGCNLTIPVNHFEDEILKRI